MSNKQPTAVEWLYNELFYFLNAKSEFEDSDQILDKAKEMEREQIMNAIKNELKLIGNYFDVSKLEQREQGHHIRFTSILKDRFDFYNETYGGNK
jgi:hypothetical protein